MVTTTVTAAAAAAIGTLALVASAGAAVSAGGYRYVTTQTTVVENSGVGLNAPCPAGEPVVGGGVVSNAVFAARVEINSTRPVDIDADGRPDDGWRAWLDNVNSNGDSAEMSVMAICDKRAKPKDYRYVVTPTVAAPEGMETPVVADCPRGEPVVSGGVLSSGGIDDEMHVNTSRPFDDGDRNPKPDDGWRSWVDNVNVGTPGQAISGFAVCDRRHSAESYAYRLSSAASDENSSVNVVRGCHQRERLVGGGFISSGFYADRMYASASFFQGPVNAAPDRWQASVNNLSGGMDGQSVETYAICRKA